MQSLNPDLAKVGASKQPSQKRPVSETSYATASAKNRSHSRNSNKQNIRRSAHSPKRSQSRNNYAKMQEMKQDSTLNLLSYDERLSLNPRYHSGDKNRVKDYQSYNSSTKNQLKKSSRRSSSIRNTGDVIRHHHILQTNPHEWLVNIDN